MNVIRHSRKLLVSSVAVGALLVAVITIPVDLAQAQSANAGSATPAASLGTLTICKVAGSGVSVGTPFTFNLSPATTSGATSVTVTAGPAPRGDCVVAGSYSLKKKVTVTEQIPAGDSVEAIAVTPSGSEVSGSENLTTGTVKVNIIRSETTVTYTDVESGILKICKVAGLGVSVGTPFTFSYTTVSGGGTVTVPAGPAPGGYCVVAATSRSGAYTVTENASSPPTYVTGITAVPPGSAKGSTYKGKLGVGVTEVTYTDQSVPLTESGYLEICKQLAAGATSSGTQLFQFTVDGQTVSMPAGACSSAIEVLAGSETVTETPVSPYVMSACSTIPAADLVSCNPTGNTATVTVTAGAVSAETILTVTNSLPSTTTVTTPDSWSTTMASGTSTTSGQDPNTSLCEFPTDADTEYGSGGPSAYPNNLINSDLGPDGTPTGSCPSGSPTHAYVVTSGGVASDGTPIPGTNWVAPNTTGASGPTASVCPAGNVPTGSDSCNFYVYDASFYLPDSLAGCSNLQISGSMMADNQAGVFLNGNYLASQPGAPNSWDGENPTGNNSSTPFAFTSPVPIGDFNVSAANTIDFVVWDSTYGQTGLDYTVTISESGCPISSGPLGSSFDDSATVTGDAAGGSPTGTVNFSVCGPSTAPAPSSPCTATDYPVGTSTLTSGTSDSATADSASFTPTATGYWCFDGTYSGDSGYQGSSDASTDECIDVTPTCVTGPGADLANCDVSGSNLNNANLDDADLSYANISGALFNSTNLTDANLTGANLYGASGGMDDFMGANLTDAYTYGAALDGSNFDDANLTSASLADTVFGNSNFTDANFTGANLTGASVSGATFTGATWSNTTCPDGTNSNNDGNTCVNNL